MRGHGMSEERVAAYVRSLYFDIQRIDGVKPLEIWNGVRETDDPFEKTNLVKNLYKIAVPLVNMEAFGRPFEQHARVARGAVSALLARCSSGAGGLLTQFPDPPVGDDDQKRLYSLVKEEAAREVRGLCAALGASPAPEAGADVVFPDGLFDFREMRIVDNELPYIIFTDKEFRVINGIAIVYIWLIDLDGLLMATLEENGVDRRITEEYRRFTRMVQKENPLLLKGRKMDSRQLVAHIHDKLAYEDYLDVFENVYRWFELARERLGGGSPA
jgi:hypothetical protein